MIVRRLGPLIALAALVVTAFAVVDKPPALEGALRSRPGIMGIPMRAAYTRCAAGVISDLGASIYLDTAGDQPGSGALSMADVICVLSVLRAPQSVFDGIDQTLSGRPQSRPTHWSVPASTFSDPWGGFHYEFVAAWRYTPDTGLDIAITVGPQFDPDPDALVILMTGR